MCHQERETICHILWDCLLLIMCGPWSKDRFRKAMPTPQIFFPLTWSIMERLPIEETELWAVLSWAIWNARNKICFEDNQARPDHYKKDCYLRQNFFNDYKKPLEKLAFSTASLFLIDNYSSNIKTFVTAKWVFQKWLLFLLKIWFVLERSVPTRGVHGSGRVDFRPSPNPTCQRQVDRRVTRNRPPASIGRDGFLLGWGSGLFEWRSGRRWS